MNRSVIFDFEGTLVDFQWRLAEAEAQLRRACTALGFAAAGNYAELWNAAADTLAPQGRIDELRQALGPIYDRWDADALARWSPRPGARELLRQLDEAGIRAAIVSNIGRAALNGALGRFGIERRFAPVVSRDDVAFMKPRTEGTLRAIAELHTAPEATLFVGDSRADVLAARAAGLRVAIVRNGECDESAFADLPPDRFVSRLDEIAGWIEE
ncbi:MAG: HAD family hydrolase [Ideonella sp.]|nr:HAD family hydrolase [Ideonella sp.]